MVHPAMQSHQDLTLTTNLIIYQLEHLKLSNFDMLIILHKTIIYFLYALQKIDYFFRKMSYLN